MDIKLFRDVVFLSERKRSPLNYINFCSKTVAVRPKYQIYVREINEIKRYQELDDLEWILGNEYEELALYRLKRGDRLVVKPTSIGFICNVKNPVLFQMLYNAHSDLFYKNKYLGSVASSGHVESLKILEKQQYPVPLTFTTQVYDNAGYLCNKPIVEYLADNRTEGYSSSFVSLSSKLTLDQREYITSHFLDNLIDASVDRVSLIQSSLFDMELNRLKELVGRERIPIIFLDSFLSRLVISLVDNCPVNDDRFEVLEWLLINIYDNKTFTSEWKEKLNRLIQDTIDPNENVNLQISIIKWLEYYSHIDFFSTEYWSPYTPLIKINKTMSVVKYLLEYEQREFIKHHVFDLICRYGTLDQIKYAHSIISEQINENKAKVDNNKEEEIFILRDPSRFEYKYHKHMLVRGDIDIVKFLLNNPLGLPPQHIGIVKYRPVMARLAKYLLSEECKNINPLYKLHINPTSVMFMGDLELIKMVEKLDSTMHPLHHITQDMLDNIIKSNQSLEIINYYHKDPRFPVNRAFVSACNLGNLEVLKFLNQTFSNETIVSLDLNSFLDIALHRYHLDIVEYIINNRNLKQGEGFNFRSLKLIVKKNSFKLFNWVYSNIDSRSDLSKVKNYITELIFKYGRLELLKDIVKSGIIPELIDLIQHQQQELLILATKRGHHSLIELWLSNEIQLNNQNNNINFQQLFIQALKSQYKSIAKLYYLHEKVENISRKDLQYLFWKKNISIIDYLYQLGLLSEDQLLDPDFYIFKIGGNMQHYLLKKGYKQVWIDHKEYISTLVENNDYGERIGCRIIKKQQLQLVQHHTKESKENVFRLVFGNSYLLNIIIRLTHCKTESLLGKRIGKPGQLTEVTRPFLQDSLIRKDSFNVSKEFIAYLTGYKLIKEAYSQYPGMFREDGLLECAIRGHNYTLVKFILQECRDIIGYTIDSGFIYKYIHDKGRMYYKLMMEFKEYGLNPKIDEIHLCFDGGFNKKYYKWYQRYETIKKMVDESPNGYPTSDQQQDNNIKSILISLFRDGSTKFSSDLNMFPEIKLLYDSKKLTKSLTNEMLSNAMTRGDSLLFSFLYYNTKIDDISILNISDSSGDESLLVKFANNHFRKGMVKFPIRYSLETRYRLLGYLYNNLFDQNSTDNDDWESLNVMDAIFSGQRLITDNAPELYYNIEIKSYHGYMASYILEKKKDLTVEMSMLVDNTSLTQLLFFDYFDRIDLQMEEVDSLNVYDDIDIYGTKLLLKEFKLNLGIFSLPNDQYKWDYLEQYEKQTLQKNNQQKKQEDDGGDDDGEEIANTFKIVTSEQYQSVLSFETNLKILEINPHIAMQLYEHAIKIKDFSKFKYLVDKYKGFPIDYGVYYINANMATITTSMHPIHIEMYQYIAEISPLELERSINFIDDLARYNIMKKHYLPTLSSMENKIHTKLKIIESALQSNRLDFLQYVLLDREFTHLSPTNHIINKGESDAVDIGNDLEWIHSLTKYVNYSQESSIFGSIVRSIVDIWDTGIVDKYFLWFPFMVDYINSLFATFIGTPHLVRYIAPKVLKENIVSVSLNTLIPLSHEFNLPYEMIDYLKHIGLLQAQDLEGRGSFVVEYKFKYMEKILKSQ